MNFFGSGGGGGGGAIESHHFEKVVIVQRVGRFREERGTHLVRFSERRDGGCFASTSTPSERVIGGRVGAHGEGRGAQITRFARLSEEEVTGDGRTGFNAEARSFGRQGGRVGVGREVGCVEVGSKGEEDATEEDLCDAHGREEIDQSGGTVERVSGGIERDEDSD